MNLTGKEFVSCRIYRGKPGVLLLSPFIGAAEIMQVGPPGGQQPDCEEL